VDAKHSIADYLRYIGATVPAEGHGWRKIKCPFHDDSNASAGINFEENRFKCHGCGVGGDVYDLIIEKQGGTYREAIKFAQTISLAGDEQVRKSNTYSSRVSSNTQSLGRRGSALSSGSSKGRSSRS
jgi:DNA primase